MSIIYNAVDLERYQVISDPDYRICLRRSLALPPQALVVLGVGRLCWQKNFPLFLRVAAALASEIPQVYFVIAGEGPDRQLLEKLAGDLGLCDKVKFLGYVQNMQDWYLASDVLFLPSRFEGTPMTVLEAKAMGLPIVASRVDGTGEILEHDVDALLAEPEDEGAFTRILRNLLVNPEWRQRLSQAALKKVRQHHDARVMVGQVEHLYMQDLESLSSLKATMKSIST